MHLCKNKVSCSQKKIMLNPITKTIELADGRTITIETGKLAKQADGAVTVRMGNTVLLATVCAAKDANPGVDFMPLQVEYKEKFSALQVSCFQQQMSVISMSPRQVPVM